MKVLAHITLALSLLSVSALSLAEPKGLSSASEGSAAGSALVVLGSMSMVAGSGYVVVKSVEVVADGVVIVLKGASEATTASIKLTGKAAQGLSLAAGTVLTVSTQTTGHLLVASGKAIAFVPNEIGLALLHHSSVTGRN